MRVIQYIGVILFFFLVSCEKNDVGPQKTRTLMVYLAGDNNLSGAMQKNINDIHGKRVITLISLSILIDQVPHRNFLHSSLKGIMLRNKFSKRMKKWIPQTWKC